jgi:hypothetical protein
MGEKWGRSLCVYRFVSFVLFSCRLFGGTTKRKNGREILELLFLRTHNNPSVSLAHFHFRLQQTNKERKNKKGNSSTSPIIEEGLCFISFEERRKIRIKVKSRKVSCPLSHFFFSWGKG